MKTMLAAYGYYHNCRKIKYPFVESIQSGLLVADRFFVCDCESTDGTREVLQNLARTDPRIQFLSHPWGSHYRIQGAICNYILSEVPSGYDYALQIQADEVVCEWTIAPFLNAMDEMKRAGANLGAPYYYHLCPDYRTQFDFIYRRKAVMSRMGVGLAYDPNSDGCSIAGDYWSLPLELHHVGKVEIGRRKETLEKELEFQELYRDLGFPDPKIVALKDAGEMDYRKVFLSAEFRPYNGPWPSALLIRKMQDEMQEASR